MKRDKKILILASLSALSLIGCKEEIPMVSLGIDDFYYIGRMQKLDLHPALTGNEYRWSMAGENGEWKAVSSERDYIFLEGEEGEYRMRFEIVASKTPYEHEFLI
ncbi:MAG: cell surface protein, partial [Muribaculaceae bacterium]|nr:cell surface protein [Muribaculaceae bacterium]